MPSSPSSLPAGEADAIAAALRDCGLITDDAAPRIAPLSGGVSCDVYRVDHAGGTLCVKRALPTLRVAAVWEAPVERSGYEILWLRRAREAGIRAPRVLAAMPDRHMFAMQWFEPADHPVWKAELMAGRVDVGFARQVGADIAAIHNATAHDAAAARDFASDDLFRQLRISPYLDTIAAVHGDLAARIGAIAARLAATHVALVHGDVSPKNILQGPDGPVFLDAECAWYGDPAFDAAFCLTHLLLKSRLRGDAAFLAAYDALAEAWLGAARWEDRGALSARTASLLAALLLARVDGKSPAEYLGVDDREFVRHFARQWLLASAKEEAGLDMLRRKWSECLEAR